MPAPSPAGELIRSSWRLERTRLAVFAAILAAMCTATVAGFRDAYPTLAQRERFAAAFKDNLALRLFYGIPHDLVSVAGYAEFRLGGLLAVALAGWAVFATVRALRGEEETGRWELLLAGPISRERATAAVIVAVVCEAVVLWLVAALVLMLVGTLPADMSTFQAFGIASEILAPAVAFIGVTALICQFCQTGRGAQSVAGLVLGLALLIRIAADTAPNVGGLRWVTPLGWSEMLRPVSGFRPSLYLPFAVVLLASAAAATLMAGRRDVGTGLWTRSRRPVSRFALLGSPGQSALRDELPALAAWVAGAGAFSFAIGAFSKSIADEARKSGLPGVLSTGITDPADYLAICFVLFGLVVALFAAMHIGSIRGEESSGRLETLLALPVGRRGWLAERAAIAAGATVILAVWFGVAAWLGAAMVGAGVPASAMFAAGLNCLPTALLFLGIGVLIFATWPRHAPGLTLTLVGVAFLWDLIAPLLGGPHWLASLSPFEHVAIVPVAAVDRGAAAAMLAIGAAGALLAIPAFARRDLKEG